MSEDGLPQLIEFFIATDASAVVEHTKRVLYLEDDDIAHIAEGELHIHRYVHPFSLVTFWPLIFPVCAPLRKEPLVAVVNSSELSRRWRSSWRRL
jgi:hypothetical protein